MRLFEGFEASINERFVQMDGDVRPATNEETRDFIRHTGTTMIVMIIKAEQ
jgi:hypothetical protein